VETAVEVKFQEHFVDAMAFPHKTDSFPNLAKAVLLPTETNVQNKSDTNQLRNKRRH
jgi:uncharacterized 2Fe-2S/4Fe-4S cluster protein (DUF4445 family)